MVIGVVVILVVVTLVVVVEMVVVFTVSYSYVLIHWGQGGFEVPCSNTRIL